MMVRETIIYAGPSEVRKAFRAKIMLPPRMWITLNQREYIAIQAVITASLIRSGECSFTDPPPCTRCPVDVFHYCETTGTECKQFRAYANGIRGEIEE